MSITRFLHYTMVILAMVFWALSFVWFKIANRVFNPITILFFRMLIASILMFVFVKLAGKLQSIAKEDWWKIALLTLFNPFLYFLGENFGLTFVSSTIASVIISLIPLFTPFISFFILRERLSVMNWIGIILSFMGVLLILAAKQRGEASWEGILLLLFAVCCAIAYTMLLKKLSFRYNVISLITWQNMLGTLYFLPLFYFIDVPGLHAAMFTWKTMQPLFALAVFCSALAFIFYAVGIKHLGASRTNVFSNISPVVTAIFAYLLLDEPIGISKAVGILIVIAGLFLSQVSHGLLRHVSAGFVTLKNRSREK